MATAAVLFLLIPEQVDFGFTKGWKRGMGRGRPPAPAVQPWSHTTALCSTFTDLSEQVSQPDSHPHHTGLLPRPSDDWQGQWIGTAGVRSRGRFQAGDGPYSQHPQMAVESAFHPPIRADIGRAVHLQISQREICRLRL